MNDPSVSIHWSATLAGSAGDLPLGYGLTKSADGSGFVIATTANLAASASGRIHGMPLTVGSAGGAFALQQGGVVAPANAPFVGTGNATDYAIVNASGQVVRSASAVSGLTVGLCCKDGSVQLGVGLDLSGGGGGSVPTGTGFRHITSGSEDAAAKLVTNTDVDAAAAIAGTKVAPDFGAQNVTTTGKVVADTYESDDFTFQDSGTTKQFGVNSSETFLKPKQQKWGNDGFPNVHCGREFAVSSGVTPGLLTNAGYQMSADETIVDLECVVVAKRLNQPSTDYVIKKFTATYTRDGAGPVLVGTIEEVSRKDAGTGTTCDATFQVSVNGIFVEWTGNASETWHVGAALQAVGV